jgi:hypothetical protein
MGFCFTGQAHFELNFLFGAAGFFAATVAAGLRSAGSDFRLGWAFGLEATVGLDVLAGFVFDRLAGDFFTVVVFATTGLAFLVVSLARSLNFCPGKIVNGSSMPFTRARDL